MAKRFYFHHFPMRLAVGIFILNSGMNKVTGDDTYLEHVYGTALTAYPILDKFGASKVGASNFGKFFGACEILLASALLLPTVPDTLVGVALTSFASGLVGLYLRIPGMREEGTLRPTQQGTALAKDIWLLGAGLTLALSPRSNETMDH